MSGAPGPLAGWRAREPRRLAAGLALAFAAGLLAMLAALVRLGEGRALRDAWPVEEGRLAVSGLVEAASVARDHRGIPHIEAASELDALRALGVVHAQDRLAQMLWLARAARGRAAEWAGAEALEADREARLLGLGRIADAQVEALDRNTRRALEAYAQGVNAHVARIRSGDAAPPFALERLGAEPTAWTPGDSLAVVKLWAWGLAGTLDTSVVLLDLIEHLGGLGARPFFPDGVGIGSIPVGTEARGPAAMGGAALRRLAGLDGHGIGSSAWVVAGRHSASGRPLLAVDLHLEPAAPALFYEAHLKAPGLDAAGATLPGVPALWCGRNAHVAWAAVNARAVLVDLYSEAVDPEDASRYHDGRRLRPLAERREPLDVRGGDGEELVVRETRHGPLVNELVAGAREPLALAWAGARARPGIGAFLALARARDAQQVRAALAAHEEPVLAMVYADAEGAGGIQVAGWIPRRGLPSGLVPVPGRSPWYDWPGPIPFADLPRMDLGSAASGWLVAADNPFAGPASAELEWLWRSGERAERIEALLAGAISRGPLDARALAAMQGDVGSERARRLVERALTLADSAGRAGAQAREIADRLRAWDGDVRSESVGAAVYQVFLDRLTRELLEPRLGADLLHRYLSLPHASPGALVERLVAGAARGGVDPQGWDEPATVGEAAIRSLEASWLFLSLHAGQNRERWAWGRLHPLRFDVILSGVKSGDAARAFGPFPYAGDGVSVAAGAYDAADPFETRVASIYRLAVDLGEAGHAFSSLAPGQSEHPGHRHRASGIARWLEARPSLLVTSPVLVEEMTAARLVLEPAP